MLREIRFLFEHRIFASATPHNGKTVSFTGLLELLDPIRFQMDTEMDTKDKEHLSEVRVRRLKDGNRSQIPGEMLLRHESVSVMNGSWRGCSRRMRHAN